MKKTSKLIGFSLLALALVLSSFPPVSAKAHSPALKDLVLYQNLPESQTAIEGDKLQLQTVRVYDDGGFKLSTGQLQWSSTNKNVASVDQNGLVQFNGKNGRTFINVTDGVFHDRIALDYKVVPKSGGQKGKPDSKPAIVKQTGDRYDLVKHAIGHMTIEEKVGQMLMPDFRNWNGQNVTQMLPEIEQLVKEYHLGGVILFRENVVTTEQTTQLVHDYQEAAEKHALLMTIDQEGGIVTRLQSGTDMPGNMALGAARSPEIAHEVGRAIGEELHSLGINMNFAPVMDVNNNPDNPVIGVRSFGEDPELVAELGVAYTEGLQSTGVAGTAKHFPGHGDTAVDSHLGLPEVPHDKERLMDVELYPFQKGMEAGIDAIMTAHVTFPQIDDTKAISEKTGEEIALPATLSKKVLTGLMREEMGYDGVITTDAMNMGAIVEHFGPVDAAIRAVEAGTDIVLMPVGLSEVRAGLLEAIETGELTEERVEASVERILSLKIKRGVIKEETPAPVSGKIANALQVVGSPEHKEIEKLAAERSITLVKNEQVLPLSPAAEEKVVVVGRTNLTELGAAVKQHHANVEIIEASADFRLTQEQLKQVQEAASVIVGTSTSTVAGRSPQHAQMQLVNTLAAQTEAPVIALGIRNPYDIMAYPEVDAYLAQYGFRQASFDAAAAAIFGVTNPAGLLPVTIPDYESGILYEYGHGMSY
ncbi:glycoside hydrolase family 3 protein [Jeotgalibacillus proteolyticus]|uniref:beta-N-acetylhexosaminidase n=1 Tax=Jeotgalibacillus proteolyticus TaxID=2082395 RepID=A0A2S5G8F0_9BACL|nr:glycoside hydrolase family 3 protein [Jeotgalibacillus proteolyticus]PPA69266.1 beta-N-acetylhexosaminidase [Jeotgalibacillus proteolyticus]